MQLLATILLELVFMLLTAYNVSFTIGYLIEKKKFYWYLLPIAIELINIASLIFCAIYICKG